MTIYDIFEAKEALKSAEKKEEEKKSSKKERFFSALAARLLFFLLLIGDVVWIGYASVLVLFFSMCFCLSGGRVTFFHHLMKKEWLSLKRASICAVALFVSLFSPALGIMVACTYFLMYDKNGIQEVIPSSLQEQFQEFMR